MYLIMFYVIKSDYTQNYKKPYKEPIILIYQFFIHSNEERYSEIKQCLKFNVENNQTKPPVRLNENLPITHKHIKMFIIK